MRPPADLEAVDWRMLAHAYGDAGDVPPLVRALYDAATADDALDELYGNVWHQGSVYPATAAVVPFLAHAARHGAVPAGVLDLLSAMADQPAGARRVRVVAAVVEAVAAAAADLLPAASHVDHRVRGAYARLVATIPTPLPERVITELSRVEAEDPDVDVRTEALAALAVHHPDPAPTEHAALAGQHDRPRLTAAVLGMARAGTPYPPSLVEVVAAHGDQPRHQYEAGRIADLLVEDPDNGFAVAARWIDAGDRDSTGSALVRRLYQTWRHREGDVVGLLTRALAGPRDADGLGVLLADLEPAAARLSRVPPDTREVLAGLAGHVEPRIAQDAQRCLARCDVPLPRTDRLPADVLAVLPAGHRPLDQVRAALGVAGTNDAVGLVGSLDRDEATHLVPDLLALAARGTAPVVVARLLGTIGHLAADPDVTAALTDAMRSGDEMLRSAAAASWIALGHPPVDALAVLHAALTTGRMPAWYLPEVGRTGPAAESLLPVVTPMLASPDAWIRTRAAIAHWQVTADPEPAAAALAGTLGAAGTPALPVHVVAVGALADMRVVPAEAVARIHEFYSSAGRLVASGWPAEIPHPDDQLLDAARRTTSTR